MKNNLKVARAMHDMTQQELADSVQVSRQTINAIEKGRFNPSTLLSLKMSKVLGIPVNDLFQIEEGD